MVLKSNNTFCISVDGFHNFGCLFGRKSTIKKEIMWLSEQFLYLVCVFKEESRKFLLFS